MQGKSCQILSAKINLCQTFIIWVEPIKWKLFCHSLTYFHIKIREQIKFALFCFQEKSCFLKFDLTYLSAGQGKEINVNQNIASFFTTILVGNLWKYQNRRKKLYQSWN